MDSLDTIDLAIADRLQRDGRLSNAKLAEQLTLSEASCWRRQRRLEELGVIEGYRAVLSRRKLGFGVLAFAQIGCTLHDEEVTAAFERAVETCPYVLSCHNTTGEADFLLQVVARDLDDYSLFVERFLRKIPGVSSIRSSISLREIKSFRKFPVEGL